MKIMKHKTIVIVCVAFLAGVFMLVRALKPSGQFSGHAEQVRIGVFQGVISSLLYIAEDKRFFEHHGLKAAFTHYDAGTMALKDLFAGKIDIGTATETPFAIGGLEKDDLRIIASVATANNMELIMRKDRGINRASDCKGKRIGLLRGSVAEFFLGAFLSFNGIPLTDVTMINLNPSEMEDALTRGTVDGIIIWQPFAYNIKQKLGDKVVGFPAQGGQDYYWLLVAREPYIRSHSAVIERLLRALLDAQDYAERHTPDAQTIVKRKFGYETTFVLSSWPQNKLGVQLNQDLLTLMEDEARWAMRNKPSPAPKMPNCFNYIYLGGLEKVRPSAVTIIH
jgi:NitT/TauT family transport system substrate-binding protein